MAKTYDELKTGNLSERCCWFILDSGSIEGEYHKQWVLDQVLRLIAGDAYPWLIELYEEDEYEWDTGIEP